MPGGRLCKEVAHVANKTTKAQPKPLTELKRLLPKITHDELLELTVCAQEEIGRRADAYAGALCEMDDPPRDALNEALAFVVRADEIIETLSSNSRVKKAWHLAYNAENDLREALNA